MAEGMLRTPIQTAIDKMRAKITVAPMTFTPEDQYKKLFEPLGIVETEYDDLDTINKTKYIFEYVSKKGGIFKSLRKLITKLGVTPVGETRLNRIYNYIKLTEEAKEIMKYHNVIQKEAEQVRRRR